MEKGRLLGERRKRHIKEIENVLIDTFIDQDSH